MGKKLQQTAIVPAIGAQQENLAILTSILRFVVYLAVGLILFWMPLYIDIDLKHVFNTAKEIQFGFYLMLALVAWVGYLVIDGKFLVPKTKAWYFYTATILFMLISITWSISPNLSIREISPQLGCFLLFTIVLTVVRNERVIQALISIAIISAFLVTVYGLFQYYDLDDIYFKVQAVPTVVDTVFGKVAVPRGESVMSTVLPIPFIQSNTFYQGILLPQKPEEDFKIYAFMGHRNYFSGYLVLILPLIVIRLLLKLRSLIFANPFLGKNLEVAQNQSLRFLWNILTSVFYSACLIYMSRAILLTQTRGAILGMVVSLCFLVLCSLLLSNRHKSATGLIAAVGGGVGLVGLILAIMFIFNMKSLFTVAIIAAIAIFLIFIFGYRHLVPSIVIFTVFLILMLGVYRVVVSDAESDVIKSRRSTIYRITQTSDWGGSAHQRTLIYSTTLRIITDNVGSLLFGKGIGTFGIHYMIYQVKLFLDTEASGKFLWDTNKSIYAHNEYIHWWSEIGFFGISLMFLFWFFYVRRTLIGLNRIHYYEMNNNPIKVLTIVALLSGTIGTLVHCVVTFDLHLMYSMVTFYCWTAFALVLSGVRFHQIKIQIPHRILIMVSGILIAIIVGYYLKNIYWRDFYWRKAFYQFSMKNWAESFDLYQKALSHDNSLGELLFDFGRVLMDSNDEPRIKKAEIDRYNVKTIKRNLNTHTMYLRPEFTEDPSKLPPNEELTDLNLTNNFIAISSFLEATHNFTDPANFHNIALCFYKESQRSTRSQEERKILAQKSEDYYRKAIDLNPIYAQSLSNLGYLKALRGEQEDALSMLSRAVALKDGRTPTTYLGLAIIYQAKQEFLGALEAFIQLEKRSPDSVDTLVRIGGMYHQLVNKTDQQQLLIHLQRKYNEFISEDRYTRGMWPEMTFEEYLGLYRYMLDYRLANADIYPTLMTGVRPKLKNIFQEKGMKPLNLNDFLASLNTKSEEYLLKGSEKSTNVLQKNTLQRQALELKIPRLQKVVKDNPNDQKAFMQLAFAFVQYGTLPINIPKKEQYLQQGIQALRHLIVKNPNDVDARLKLADAYAEIQDMERLKEAYRNVLTIMSPTDPRRGSVERKILFLKQ